jgi:hypothetical protein
MARRKIGGSSQTGTALLITGLPAARQTMGLALAEHLAQFVERVTACLRKNGRL